MAGLALAAVLVVPAAGVGADSLRSVTYEIDHDEGAVSYSQTAPAVPDLNCENSWRVSASSLGSAIQEGHAVEITVDVGEGEVFILERRNGTTVWQTYVCEGVTPRVDPPREGWRSHRASSSEETGPGLVPGPLGQACEGEPKLGLERLAPFSGKASDEAPAPADPTSACVEARAAAEFPEGDGVPFTGTVNATLTDGGGQTVWSRTCTVVAGTCWDEGRGSADLALALPEGQSDWALTCETSPVLDSFIPPVGTFSCRAWLG